MNARNALRTAFLAASVLVLSCQDRTSVVAPEPGSAPVAFRLAADGRQTPVVDIVEIDVSVFRDSAYQPFDLRRFAWNDSLAALQVPLHTPLRFQLRGILRRENRDVIAWTASQDDTLDDPSAEANVVTFTLLTRDTTAPDVTRGITSPGASLNVLDAASGTLELNLPSGQAGGTVALSTALAESLYVDGSPRTPVAGAWTLELGLGSSSVIQLVGANKATSTWTLSVTSGDRLGLDIVLGVDNGATRTNRGDTAVFTLPYVVDSTPRLTMALQDPKDRPKTIAFNGRDLDASLSVWSAPLPVPEAGSTGFRATIVSTDSLGNGAILPVLVLRSTQATEPELSWYTPPAQEPWGAHTARFVLKVVGGDSLRRPVFTSSGLGTASCDSIPLLREGTTVLWQGSVPLLQMDSGSIVASVTNRLGTSWSLEPAAIRRFDPAGPDSLAPSLSRLSPSGTGWIRSGSVSTVTGRAIDERAGKLSIVAVHGGKPDTVSWNPADSSWSWNLDWTADGDSLVTFTAIDSTGNRSAPLQVRLVRDTRLPTLAWSTGMGITGDTLVTLPRNVAFSLVATDTYLRGVTALRNGATDTIALADIDGGEWFRRLEFPSGWSTWTFAATDSAGNRQARVLRVLAGDTTGPALTVSVNNRASFRRVGDTLVYILPYVLDSALVARIAVDPVGDQPSSLSWDGKPLSIAGPTTWTIPLEIPVAGPAGARTFAVAAKDSVGNAAAAQVRLVRDTNATAPSISWDPPPPAKPWGSGLDTIQVLIVGGDSLQPPAFSSQAFASSISAPVRVQTRGDSVWWRGVVTLGSYDSGKVLAAVRNLLGSSWTTPEAWIHRFDPAGPDSLPPTFSISPVPEGGWTRSNAVALRGTASDARSSSVRVLVRRAAGDTVDALWSKVDGSWSIQVALAADVDTTITVWAIDTAGNASLPVPVRLRRDTRKPGFSWSTVPTITRDTLRTNDPVQTLSVNTSAPDLRRVWAVRATTTDTLTFTSAAAGIWSTDAPLPQGWSTWSVGASDSAGNDSVRVLRVLRDTIPPTAGWSVSGTNPEGKYAVATARDTIWISSDTSVTLGLSSTTGFPGVSVPSPSVDSAGALVGIRSSLVMRPAAGTTTTWTLTATDELGNTARPVKLVVVGLAPVSGPVARIGSSASPVATGSALPWPKIVRHSCPDAGSFLQGASKADTLVSRTAALVLNCRSGRIRSTVRTFAWSIADTASVEIPYQPEDSTSATIVVDGNRSPWVVSQRASQIQQHTFDLDSVVWIQRKSWYEGITGSLDPVMGASSNGTRYFVFNAKSSPLMSKWFALGSSSGLRDTLMAGDYILRGDNLTYRKVPSSVVRMTSISNPALFSTTTFAKGSMPESYARQAWTSTDLLYMNSDQAKVPTPARIQLQVRSGTGATVLFKFPAEYSNLGFAARQNQAGYYVVGRNDQGRLIAEFYSSAASTAPLRQNLTLAALVANDAPIRASWEGSDLWVNVPGNGTFRLDTDLASVTRSWSLTGAMGVPESDGHGGAWTLAKVGSSFRLYHLRGSAQE